MGHVTYMFTAHASRFFNIVSWLYLRYDTYVWGMLYWFEGIMTHVNKSCHIYMYTSHASRCFNTFPLAMFTNFKAITLESWSQVMWYAQVPLFVCACVLQCFASCCSVLQCVAVFRHFSDHSWELVANYVVCSGTCICVLQCVAVCCSVLQRVAACCSVLQCVAVFRYFSDYPWELASNYVVCSGISICVCVRIAVCCSVLQCVAVCCSVHKTIEQ